MKKALILVDLQKDFCLGGALAVKGGDEVIELANSLIESKAFDVVVATIDHHPHNHKSFASQHKNKKVGDVIKLNGLDQVLWPDHCVKNTEGVQLHEDLSQKINYFVLKGENREFDSYSGFFDNGKKNETELHYILQQEGIEELVVMGLALDYCVLYTVEDAVSLGYKVSLIESGCRPVSEDTGKAAIKKMKKIGVEII